MRTLASLFALLSLCLAFCACSGGDDSSLNPYADQVKAMNKAKDLQRESVDRVQAQEKTARELGLPSMD
ncbi:MAG: hypothetical protein JRI97_00340 [Deltaproteobacteria bacterium]|nr:hypothetical protein [Deltaproteobacteria bacterium]